MTEQKRRFFRLYPAIALVFCFLMISISQAANVVLEQQWSQQLSENVDKEQVRLLKAVDLEFLGLYIESVGQPQGAAVVVHGAGHHPDWPEVISPLRNGLPDYGWASLSIQMPGTDLNAPAEEYAPLISEGVQRISSAVEWLKKEGIFNIAIIGHDLGATSALAYLSGQGDEAVRVFAAISLSGNTVVDDGFNRIAAIRKLKIPVLDIYGGEDLGHIIDSAKFRRDAARRGQNGDYSQVRVPGADHFFTQHSDRLVKRVRSWLQRGAPGSEIETN